jgi:hypothetical protein
VTNGKLVVPSSAVTIGFGPSDFCQASINSIEFSSPSHLRVIQDGSFASSGLTAIHLPAAVRYVGAAAFLGSAALSSVTSSARAPTPPRRC